MQATTRCDGKICRARDVALLAQDMPHTKRTCEANQVSENSSFIFTVCVKSVQLYHFKLAYVVLHMAVRKFFETHF